MKFFIDSADIEEIRFLATMGIVDGVTTNPSILSGQDRSLRDVVCEICSLIPGPVSVEVVATDTAGMITQGKLLAEIASNVVVKIPLTQEGLVACHQLRQEGILVNATLCFSAAQALLAAKAGATYISPFVGRLDDIGIDGMNLIQTICTIYKNDPLLTTQVLVASVRSPMHVIKAAEIGAHVVTAPAKVFNQMLKHPLTDTGLKAFLTDWGNRDDLFGCP